MAAHRRQCPLGSQNCFRCAVATLDEAARRASFLHNDTVRFPPPARLTRQGHILSTHDDFTVAGRQCDATIFMHSLLQVLHATDPALREEVWGGIRRSRL
eukprot:12399977-Karenia_brevis.AAC.1